MPYFANADEVYETLGRLMEDAVASAGLGAQAQQTDASVRLALSNPAATITLTFSAGQVPAVAFGDSGRDSTLTLEMSADTAHEIFLGKLTLFEATSGRRLTQHGNADNLVALWRSASFALPARYEQILTAIGRTDLAQIDPQISVQDPSLLTPRI